MLTFLRKGFALLLRNNEIWIIYILLGLLSFLPLLYMAVSPFSPIILLTFVFSYFNIAYGASTPAFLAYKQKHAKPDYALYYRTLLRNARRLLLPLLMLLVAAVILVILLSASHTLPNIPGPAGNIVKAVFSAIIFSFLEFTSIYFSVENIGLFKSIKNSFSFSFKNLDFTLPLALVLVIVYIASYSLPATSNFINFNLFDVISNFVRQAVFIFINLGIQATVLLYYQSKKKK